MIYIATDRLLYSVPTEAQMRPDGLAMYVCSYAVSMRKNSSGKYDTRSNSRSSARDSWKSLRI